ncbi:hypothetical protein NQ315_003681 [Exocentrus adspersus]|uniref:Regulatory protein zeste n=1 Tax=Exocentrus adspersus TaxID=1586481 RepID=A0AAV8V7D7_9CUCU|nr:hypothetical protein NQ315_003681 [Exocentrus adspersus]
MRVTSQHWEEFLSVAERHPALITSKFNGAQGKAEGNALWTSVATKLNSLGFGEKSVAEWRRAVTDWKSKTKAKASRLRLSSSQTGGGPVDATPLTPLENKLLLLMGKKGFEGNERVKEMGILAPFTQPTEPISITKPDSATNYDIELSTVSTAIDENYEEEQGGEHDYWGKRKITYSSNYDFSQNAKQLNKRMKTKAIPRVAKHLEDLTSESVTILKNIDKNTSRIADSFEKLVNHFVEKQE